jgi:hypothetical protein
MKKLSITQLNALALARRHGGKLVRYPEGFWAIPGLTVPRFSTQTVKALSDRGYFVMRSLGKGFWVEAEVCVPPSRKI